MPQHQRAVELVTELTKERDHVGRRGNKAPHTLYVLDEPHGGPASPTATQTTV